MTIAIRLEWWLSFPLLVLLAGDLVAQAPQPQQPPGQPQRKLPALVAAKPIKEDPKDDELRKLLKARHNEAVAEMKARYQEFLAGRATFDVVAEVAQRLVQSGLEVSDQPAERVALLTQYLEVTTEVEKIAQLRVGAATVSVTELHKARYHRLDAEIRLHRAKREAGETKEKP